MRAPAFVVGARLGVDRFDHRREARERVRAVMAEMKALLRADDRLLRVQIVRVEGARELRLTIAAASFREAYDIGSAMVRSAIHAAGDSTAGWERIRPQVLGADARDLWGPPSSWAEAAMVTSRRAVVHGMPPWAATSAGPSVIDLR